MNPFLYYSVSCLAVLVLYTVHWSLRYPPLTWGLGVFLAVTILLHSVSAMRWNRFAFPKKAEVWKINHIWLSVFVYLLWMVDFWWEGGIPLVKILLRQPYNYRLFGAPSLHVFTVTFASFYTAYLFYLYRLTRNKLMAWLWMVQLMGALLIFSRAMLFFNIFTCLVLYLMEPSSRTLPRMLTGAIMGIVLLYFFGVLGTVRVSMERQRPYSNELFMEVGQATPGFAASPVPKEFFWGYVYITSPLANLQTNVQRATLHAPSLNAIGYMSLNEFAFDFISKRVNRWLGHEREHEVTIGEPFNVSTVYSICYSYQNWLGMILMAGFLLALPWCYRWCLQPQSATLPVGIAILCTLYFFLMYDNTIRVTGLGFQLVYPVLGGWLERMKILKTSPVEGHSVSVER